MDKVDKLIEKAKSEARKRGYTDSDEIAHFCVGYLASLAAMYCELFQESGYIPEEKE